jgi:hypothetical protein
VRRTQLYLEEDLWVLLRDRAKREKTTISELVRRAVRERYLGDPEKRRAALMGIVGLWKGRTDLPDTETYIRRLRKNTRRRRLAIH